MRRLFAILLSLAASAALAQYDVLPKDPNPDVPLKKLPEGAILIRGAEPSASDSRTPLPENGRVANDAYGNDYFGLSFKLPEQLMEKYQGPPPSDSGVYVLAELSPSDRYKGTDKATVFVSAQDHFFALVPEHSAADFIKRTKEKLPSYYQPEGEPQQVKIAGRTFQRFNYTSAVAGIHWVILATDIRCHTVEFVFTGRDPKFLEKLVAALDEMTLKTADDTPACIADYAPTYRVDPVLTDHKYNPIPVRVIIDKKGRVKHVHVLSAFPEQARVITEAILQWRFKEAPAEIETGFIFGKPQRPTKAVAVTASD